MAKGFGWLKTIWTGLKTKSAAQIDDAERVIIDSSALHCPICLRIFITTPVVLPCGHSFCQSCIRRLIEYSLGQHENIYQPTYECALCRKKCSCDAVLTKNFVVDALLQSICEIALEESESQSNNIKISLDRTILKLAEYEKEKSKLERALEEEKKRSHKYFQMSLFYGAALLLIFIRYIKDLL